jgi:hypothetical protein
MTFDHHDNEQRMSIRLTNKAAKIARAIGPEKLNVNPRTGKYTIVRYQSTHNTVARSWAPTRPAARSTSPRRPLDLVVTEANIDRALRAARGKSKLRRVF